MDGQTKSFYDRITVSWGRWHPKAASGGDAWVACRCLAQAKALLSPMQFSELAGNLPFTHTASGRSKEKIRRLIAFGSMDILGLYPDQIPKLGWSVWRQLPPLADDGDAFLRRALETGRITAHTTREELDTLRSEMRGSMIAPRHRGQTEDMDMKTRGDLSTALAERRKNNPLLHDWKGSGRPPKPHGHIISALFEVGKEDEGIFDPSHWSRPRLFRFTQDNILGFLGKARSVPAKAFELVRLLEYKNAKNTLNTPLLAKRVSGKKTTEHNS